MYTSEKTQTLQNTLNLDPPFILQVGDERKEITEHGRLEFSERLTMLHDDDDPLRAPVPLVSTGQEIRLWIGGRLAFEGGTRGSKEFGRYVRPEGSLPELHLDPRIVRAVS